MKISPLDIISGCIEIFIGILIAFTFIMIYFFSDFSSHGEGVLWTFRILYLGVLPGVGLIFIIRGIIRFFRHPKDDTETGKNEVH